MGRAGRQCPPDAPPGTPSRGADADTLPREALSSSAPPGPDAAGRAPSRRREGVNYGAAPRLRSPAGGGTAAWGLRRGRMPRALGGGSRSGGPQQQFTVEVSWRPFAQPTSPPPSFSTGRGEARQALHPPAPRGPPPRSSTRRAPRSAARPEPGSEQRSVTGGGTEGHRKRILPCKEMSRSHLTPLSSSPSSPPPPRLTPQQTKGSERGAKGAAPAGNGADGEGRRSDTTKRQRAPIGLSAGLGGTVQPPLLLGTTAAGGGTCKDTAA